MMMSKCNRLDGFGSLNRAKLNRNINGLHTEKKGTQTFITFIEIQSKAITNSNSNLQFINQQITRKNVLNPLLKVIMRESFPEAKQSKA